VCQVGVQGDERVGLQLCEGEVLGLVGLGPAQLVGEVPGSAAEDGVAEEADRHGPDAGELVEGGLGREPAPMDGLVQGRKGLGPQQGRGEQLVVGRDLEPLTGQLEDDVAVDDESGHVAVTLAHPHGAPRPMPW
jgi:hypothetical protein